MVHFEDAFTAGGAVMGAVRFDALTFLAEALFAVGFGRDAGHVRTRADGASCMSATTILLVVHLLLIVFKAGQTLIDSAFPPS